LLSTADLEGIVGAGVEAGRRMPTGGWVAGQCAWSTPTLGFEIAVGTAVSLSSYGDPTVADAKAKLESYKARASRTGGSVKAVNVGDGAALTEQGIAAYKGDVYLEVQNLGLTDDQLTRVVRRAMEAL
jgi:hypothetical protein